MPPRLLRPTIPLLPRPALPQRRTFLPIPPAGPQVFSERRTLPHPAFPLYALIRDIDSYSHFLPYCSSSVITARDERGLPVRAALTVGFAGVEETFESKVECSHGVEFGLDGVEGARGTEFRVSADGGGNEIFEKCRTLWTVTGVDGGNGATEKKGVGQSEVSLEIEFAFKNPMYAALSAAVMPKVAGVMMRKFEERAAEVLRREKQFG